MPRCAISSSVAVTIARSALASLGLPIVLADEGSFVIFGCASLPQFDRLTELAGPVRRTVAYFRYSRVSLARSERRDDATSIGQTRSPAHRARQSCRERIHRGRRVGAAN